MLRRFRIPLIVVGTLLLLLAGGGVWFWLAVRHVPHFYVDALAVDPVELKQDSDKMVRRTAALSNDARKEGHWDAVFTADQINGWLAVDREENHPQLIPHEFHDPRVAIHDGQIIVGCRYEGRQMNTVLSLTADVYLQLPNVVALRIEPAARRSDSLAAEGCDGPIGRGVRETGLQGGIARDRSRPLVAAHFAAADQFGSRRHDSRGDRGTSRGGDPFGRPNGAVEATRGTLVHKRAASRRKFDGLANWLPFPQTIYELRKGVLSPTRLTFNLALNIALPDGNERLLWMSCVCLVFHHCVLRWAVGDDIGPNNSAIGATPRGSPDPRSL